MPVLAARSALKRGWSWVSGLGVNPANRSQARSAAAVNHFAAIAGAVTAGQALVMLLWAPPTYLLAGALHLVLATSLAAALALNARGATVSAASLALIASTAQMTWLSYYFSAASGFHFLLLGAAALAFAMYRHALRLARLAIVLVSGAAFAVAELAWADPAAAPGLPSDALTDGLLIVNTATTVGMVYSIAWFNQHYLMRERALNVRLLHDARTAAHTDSLTGLANRRAMVEQLALASSRGDYSVALVDVDRFKKVNDAFGHPTGDVVLGAVGSALADELGDHGTLARWGGEEFCILLPRTVLTDAIAILDRVRAGVPERVANNPPHIMVTVSAGVAYAPAHTPLDTALRCADAQLYAAKRAGRNAVRGDSVPAQAS